MCGRFSLAPPDQASLAARFGFSQTVDVGPRFNIAPGSEVLVVVGASPPRAERMLWGLIAPWAKDPSSGFKAINARAETVASKPMFRESFEKRRCLVIADGFYEWQRVSSGKRPWHVTRLGGAPFAFAGLWASWGDGSAAAIASVAIVTVEAPPALARIHDRMPVILDPSVEARWCDPETQAEELARMLVALPDREIAARPVSSAVNSARYDGPECLDAPHSEDAS